MTQTKLEARTRKASSRGFALWHMAPTHDGECVRWETLDGRWMALCPGQGASSGSVLVTDSAGRCEASASFEAAFELARHWRAH